MLWLLLLACSGRDDAGRRPESPEDTTTTGALESDTAVSDTAAPPTVPTRDPLDTEDVARIEEAVEAFATEAIALDFAPVQAAVANLKALYEPECPVLLESPLGPYWSGDCTTPVGRYRLFGNFYDLLHGWEEAVDLFGTEVVEVWGPEVEPGWQRPAEPPLPVVEAYFAVCTAERGANVLHLNGAYHDLRTDWVGIVARFLWIEGGIDDPGQSEGWAARGLEPSLTRTELDGASGGRVRLYQGAIGALPTAWSTVWVQDLSMGNAAAGDLCEAEPEGTIAVRDVEGAWYDLSFDGDTGGACDGCGRITIAGQPVGTACPDLGALLADIAP